MSSTPILRSSDDERRRLRFALADIVMGFPYGEYLYPGAMEAVRKARTLGPVAVLSEGDATFQPHKIWRTGLDPEVDGNVLVFDRKLDHLDEMTAAFPADHYVLVEDKPDILAAVKRALRSAGDDGAGAAGKYGQRRHCPKTRRPIWCSRALARWPRATSRCWIVIRALADDRQQPDVGSS